ncbi:MAG: hypothetical protein MK183_11965 [Verrucomicrobiales bacterium]|nr:hypothetical protein [Verrucomicrobiales bacterium]MED5586580.1 hypothetical protein [Verrucomicrobiota bacterium]
MRHQPWDPFRSKTEESCDEPAAGHQCADWQGELLALGAFVQGFSETLMEISQEEEAREHLSL